MKNKIVTGRDIERAGIGQLQMHMFKQPATRNAITGYAHGAILPPDEFLKYQAAIHSVLNMLDFDEASRRNETIKDIELLELKKDDPVNQILDGTDVFSIYADNSVNFTYPVGQYTHLSFHINIYQMIMENVSQFKKEALDAAKQKEISPFLDGLGYYGAYFKVNNDVVTVEFTNKFKRELFKAPYFELKN